MGKTVVAINEVDFGSTGRIITTILHDLNAKGYETYFCCHEHNDTFKNEYHISSNSLIYTFNKVLSRIDASDGFNSKRETKKLIKFLDKKKPSLLWLNNLHGSYINLPILLNWIRTTNTKVIWTLHDCWLFTGKCAHFTFARCNKWQTCCNKCPNLHTHPRAYLFDHSQKLFLKKRKLFENLQDLITFITPSKWLKDNLSLSFLSNYCCEVINNGADYINNNHIASKEDKIILFAAASPFTNRKGIEFIERLAKELDSKKYTFYIAGKVDKNINLNNAICLGTLSKEEMQKYYSIADVFLNPTLEDTFPTVNVESLASGTPVITFENNGGSDIFDKDSGVIVKYANYDAFKKAVLNIKKKDEFIINACKNRAKLYSIKNMCDNYYTLIEGLLK